MEVEGTGEKAGLLIYLDSESDCEIPCLMACFLLISAAGEREKRDGDRLLLLPDQVSRIIR